MKPYFASEERQKAFDEAARRWIGTPYFANSAARGHGVGCVELIHEIIVESSDVRRMKLPVYQTDFAHHASKSQLIRFLLDAEELQGRLVFVPVTAKRMCGDLIGLRSGRLDHHLAAATKWGQVIHAVEGAGVVCHGDNDAKFNARILYVMRLMEAGTP